MNKHSIIRIVLKLLAIVLVLAFVVWLNKIAIGNDAVQSFALKFGYGGIFLSSVISGFNLIVPVPIIGFYPLFIDAGFSPLLLITSISMGMMLGDVFGYLVGNAGRDIIKDRNKHSNMFKSLERLRQKHQWAPIVFLFVFASLVPLPNEIIVVPMAFMGYKLRHMIIALFFGHILFNVFAAFGFFHIVNI